MLPQYIEAFTLTPPEVLRRRLLPFTLGHAYLLEASGNGFAIDSQGGFTLESLTVAVQICTRDFRGAIRFLRGEEPGDIAGWAEECADCNLDFEAAKFANYTRAYLTIPPRWRKTRGAGVCRVPWPLHVAAGLAGEGALTPAMFDSLMNSPCSESLVMLAARQAWGGDDSLQTEEEIAAIETLKGLENGNG